MQPTTENLVLSLGCILYAVGFTFAFLKNENKWQRYLLASCSLGWLLHSLSLALRWQRVGHGPFINLYEILSSNLWSLMLVYLIFNALAKAPFRAAGRYAVPVLVLLMFWLLTTEPRDSHLPATYDTPWLYFHVLSGKVFLGLLMLATALAVAEFRSSSIHAAAGSAAQSLSYRLLAFAFCFESLMLLFGAVWAQDAWGRYWAWDPLETWAFLTWLSLIFVLHWRLNYSRRRVYAALVAGCFVMAFLTFFGVPFVSTAPHQVMI